MWQQAMLVQGAPHCALEYYRWAVRAVPRTDGRRFRALLRPPLRVPTLQLHGGADPCVLPETARGSGHRVVAPYQWHEFAGVGHFPQEEAPAEVSAELLRWVRR